MKNNDPSSPRRKIINLMYLIFIALFALQFPAEKAQLPLQAKATAEKVKPTTTKPDSILIHTPVTANSPAPTVAVGHTAVISPMHTRVLYGGVDNPLQLAVSGIADGALRAHISAGTLIRNHTGWIAHPPDTVSEALITVSARLPNGRKVTMEQTAFHVRPLPIPLPYLEYTTNNGQKLRFNGGLLSKQHLLTTVGIRAAIADALLDIPYAITRFELIFFDSMGNALPLPTEGNLFSTQQKTAIRQLARGNRFYITRITARSPDGKEQILPTIEISIN